MITARPTISAVPRLRIWPYVPSQPEWASMPELFAAAAQINPDATTFIGQVNGTEFWFQEHGNPVGVVVTRTPEKS